MPAPFPRFTPRTEERVNPRRVQAMNTLGVEKKGPVVYWMGRDRRLHDNWALRYAEELAQKENRSLLVLAILQIPFENAIQRQHQFSLEGYRDMANEAEKRGISLLVKMGTPDDIIVPYLTNIDASALIMDLTVLRVSKKRREGVVSQLDIPIFEVDAHNIVPLWVASEKKEYAAYTLRPKIHRIISEFLTKFPDEYTNVRQHQTEKTDWKKIEDAISHLPEHPLYKKNI